MTQNKDSLPPMSPGAFRLILWIIWASFLGSLVVYKIIFTFGIETDWSAFGIIPLGIIVVFSVAALAIRLLLIPRFTEAGKLLPVFVVGLAIAEVPAFVGFFVFPEVSISFFIVCVVLVSTYIPVFKFELPHDQNS